MFTDSCLQLLKPAVTIIKLCGVVLIRITSIVPDNQSCSTENLRKGSLSVSKEPGYRPYGYHGYCDGETLSKSSLLMTTLSF